MRLSTLIAKLETSTINAVNKSKPVVATSYTHTKVCTANTLRTIATKLDPIRMDTSAALPALRDATARFAASK